MAVAWSMPDGLSALNKAMLKWLKANNSTTGFFDHEANVNGIWGGFFAETFYGPGQVRAKNGEKPTGGNAILIAPEGQAVSGTTKKRGDFLISQFVYTEKTSGNTIELCPVLQFEGKSAVSGDNFTAIKTQLQTFFQNANIKFDKDVRTCWGVGAKGTKCWFFLWNFQSTGITQMELVNSNDSSGRKDTDLQIASTGWTEASVTYDIVDDYGMVTRAVHKMSENLWPRIGI